MTKFSGHSLDDLFKEGDKWFYEDTTLKPTSNHAVLFTTPLRDHEILNPFHGEDKWDQEHVRLPCSRHNTYKLRKDRESHERWLLITSCLSPPYPNTALQLEQAIKGYNASYESEWDFIALRKLLDDNYNADEKTFIFKSLLPGMITLALSLPKLIRGPIPLLKQGSSKSISMSQLQVACLLANAFFCTFPMRNTDNRNAEYATYPKINFNRLFQSEGPNVIEKLKCIIHYFKRVLFVETPKNTITFQRQHIDPAPNWEESSIPIGQTKFHITSEGKLEEARGMLQVDFANRFVGGGVLSRGCVQEEIRFVISPELIVARLFTECLGDNEALIVLGFEQFSKYTGYAANFRFLGDFVDKTPVDRFRRKKSKLVAIDATAYNSPHEQFDDCAVLRDLNKAYAGFFCDEENHRAPVETGLWGCGVYNGNPVRSAIIQLIACTESRRNLAFYTFGDHHLENELANLFAFFWANETTVGQLYNALKSYRNGGSAENLVSYIEKRCGA